MFVQDLAHLSIFQGLSECQIAQIQPLLEVCDYSRDTVVFEQGDPAQYLYILFKGEVLVRYKAYDGPVITVARIGPGGVFGWSSALGRPTYTSGAVCTQDSHVFRMSGKALLRLCDLDPDTGSQILTRLTAVISERLNTGHTQILGFLTQGIDGTSDQPEEGGAKKP
ncbi:MAG TPA: Crp/Fnr family transcriptional regulator [Anaerolineaceae bacterium]|nr:Crp/Fnr family transcriptional regulator [Anaerolineaceae bacterium]